MRSLLLTRLFDGSLRNGKVQAKRALCCGNRLRQAADSQYKDTPLERSLVSSLEGIVGDKNISQSATVLQQHGQDEGPHKGRDPQVVVWPENTDQVQEICRLCHANRVPIIPHGTGTGLEGGTAAVQGGVCVDLTLMDKVRNIWPDDFVGVVEPGVTREGLNQEVRDQGLWFPVDPGANASICGMCATSASGTNAVRYGTMKDNTLNLEVVLADGKLINTAGKDNKARKNSAGYDLTGLILGSEGTLGLITAATVRLHALPETVAAAVVSFPSIQATVNTVVTCLQYSMPLARLELLDEVQMMACNKYSGLDYPELPTLFIEFHGSETEVERQVEMVKYICDEEGGGEFQWAAQQEDRTKLWTARHRAYYAALALRPGCRSVTTDVCVPPSMLPEMIEHSKEDIRSNGLVGPIVGHVGDGNFHSFLLFDPDKPEEFAACKGVSNRMGRKAIELGGTCTGEHGVGQGKIGLLEDQYGVDGVETMRLVRRALDPLGILNPGKVITM